MIQKRNALTRLLIMCLLLSCTSLAARQKDKESLFGAGAETRHSFMSVSTNTLYDAAFVPNIGLEINIYDTWTLSVNGMFAWWTMEQRHLYWRVYGGDVTVRKYFGRQSENRSLTGHHLGAYGQALSYDLEVGYFGRMVPELSYGGGIEYGYSFPVSKSLNVDLFLGVGYLGTKMYDYVESDGHYVWRATIGQQWVGPTKAGVSLVWLIESKKTR